MTQLHEVGEKVYTEKEAIQAMLDCSSYYFYRSFYDCKKSRTAVCIVNRLFETDKSLEPSLLILSMLPAMRWVLKAESLDTMTSTIFLGDDERQQALELTQQLLTEISGCEPRLMLERRRKSFEKIRFVVDNAVAKINRIEQYPARGHTYAAMLRSYYLGEETDASLTQYTVNHFLEEAIRVFAMMVTEEEKKAIYELVAPEQAENGSDVELQFAYHNINLLMDEYCKILFYANCSDDKAMQLLKCDSESEMLALTKSDTKYNQAYLLVEYSKLIGNAIELLKEFPVSNYYNIVKAMIQQKQGNYTERNSAELLAMSLTSYRDMCRNAMAVLSVALFGSGCRIFADMLMCK